MLKLENLKLLSLIIFVSLLIVSCASQTSTIAGRIGFTKELDEPSARGQLTRLSPENSDVMYRFCLSPNNEIIIFSGTQSGGSDNLIQLWKISASGSTSPTKITSGGAAHKIYPSFTSDGNYIVYSSNGQIWRVKSDGSGGKMKIPGSGSQKDFAPNVSSKDVVTFCSVQSTSGRKDKYLIWTSNLNGGNLTQIREGMYPKWSPDGDKIVFNHKGEIWLINADGTNLIQLTNSEKVNETLPSFSPDGEKIVYTSNEGKNGEPMKDYNIWTMKIDGSEKKQETELDSWDSWPIWGNDGIYFLSARAQKAGEQIQRIWKLSIE